LQEEEDWPEEDGRGGSAGRDCLTDRVDTGKVALLGELALPGEMVWLRELTLLGKVALLEVPPLPAEIGLLGRGGSASRCSLARRDDSN
jgi:hypothetical protein